MEHFLAALVREWTAEGLAERRECFEPVLLALLRALPAALAVPESPERVASTDGAYHTRAHPLGDDLKRRDDLHSGVANYCAKQPESGHDCRNWNHDAGNHGHGAHDNYWKNGLAKVTQNECARGQGLGIGPALPGAAPSNGPTPLFPSSCSPPPASALPPALPPALPAAFPRALAARPRARVLLCGGGLGRLAMEIAASNFSVEVLEGNELLNAGREGIFAQPPLLPKSLQLFPYCLRACNRRSALDEERVCLLPDVRIPPSSLPIACPLPLPPFGSPSALARSGVYDSLVIWFGLAAFGGALAAVRSSANLLKAGGVLVCLDALGALPLPSGAASAGPRLSWEELKFALQSFFTVEEESFRDVWLACDRKSMIKKVYHCILFTARRHARGPHPSLPPLDGATTITRGA
eukprot:GHVT01069865.1.p1 GENE.GHVT01069865.1~~GHVT01069865.1.p1  ORF type:complete len:410 (-),score=101.25 GHVT01069865.1:523-1752(-)